jgi:hypothetical protein
MWEIVIVGSVEFSIFQAGEMCVLNFREAGLRW